MRSASALAGIVAAALLLSAAVPVRAAEDAAASLPPLNEVIQFIQFQHKSGLTEAELTEAAIEGILGKLDPFTAYVPPEDFFEFRSHYFVDVEPEAGAEDGTSEPGGTDENDESGEESDASAYVDNVWSGSLAEGVGYIRITSFTEQADERFGEALVALREDGALQSLVLDLRGNGGGNVASALGVAKSFIERGIAYYTVGRDGYEIPTTILDGEKASFRTVVLVDVGSASASEMLAGALRDRAGARLIGERTYGKGSIQNVFGLSNGGGLAVTVAEYLTPDKYPIHGVGLSPDTEVDGAAAQLLAAARAASDGPIAVVREGETLLVGDVLVEASLPWHAAADGRVYVALRPLAALAGGELRWDGVNGGEAIVSIAGAENVFSAANGKLVILDGVGYVEASAFPGLTVTVEGERLLMATGA
ncbi:S41 family peptidase [Paenibacillus sp. TRM 82003]|nr:S41 family peptidase [Paenibacillus sp. TRM 82003]